MQGNRFTHRNGFSLFTAGRGYFSPGLVFCIFFFSGILGVFSQEQSSNLRESVKKIREIISGLEIYDGTEKRRLYGAVPNKSAIEFQLQASPLEEPTSVVIGVATDGSIEEMEIKVYTLNSGNKNMKLIRTDRIANESEWVFEIIQPAPNYLVDIRVIKSKNSIPLVELIHAFYYGHQSGSAFSTTRSKTKDASFEAPKQTGDSLAPIDTYNRFEMFKKDLSK
jgi:hypothetical protein